MNFNDEGTLTLKGETTQFDNQLKELNTKAKELKQTLKEIEQTSGKGSDEWKKYKAELDQTRASQAALNAEMKKMDVADMTLGQLKNHIKDLNKELLGLVPGTKAFIDTSKRLDEAKDHFNGVTKQVDTIKKGAEDLGQPTLWGKITNGAKGMATVFQAFMALQAVQFLWDMGKAIFDITAKFEKYEKVLSTALGSEKEAKESMKAIQVMAANTAYSVDELTEGYVKMVNRGLRPSQKEMTALADLAASQGKTFDQLVEAVLDAMGAEFERLKEFGAKGKKAGETLELSFKNVPYVIKNTGDEFQILEKHTGKLIDKFSSQEDAVFGVMTAFGKMEGVQGQNAQMMETLGGKTSNLGDNFDSLMVTLGNGLRPVFVSILDLLNASIPVLLVVGQTIGSVIVMAKSLIVGMVETVKNGGMAIISLGDAVAQVAQGNLSGAKESLDKAADYGAKTITSMKTNIQKGVDETIAIWKDPSAEIEAKFAAKKQGEAHWKTLSEEQKKGYDEQVKAYKAQGITLTEEQKNTLAKQIKANEDFNINLTDDQKKSLEERKKAHEKHLKEVEKANEDAVQKLKELNQELYLDHVKRTKGELEASREKLRIEHEAEVEAVQKSVASKTQKDALIAALDKKYQNDLTELTEQQNKTRAEIVERWVDDEFVKKIKKAQDFANSEKKRIAENIADEKERTELIQKVEKWLDDEVRGIKKEKADDEEKQRQEDLKKSQELADKKLKVEKELNEQEREAKKALYEWNELNARGNAKTIAKVKKGHLKDELDYMLEKLRIEEQEQKAKAQREITDSEQLKVTIANIEDRYRTEKLVAEKKTADEIKQVEKELKEARNARWKEGSDGIKALLEGDLNGFVSHMGNIVKGEKSAWQERLSENMEKYEAVAQLAQAAVDFLKKLSEERLKKELANIEKEKTERIAAEEAMTESTIENLEAQRDAELERIEQELLANTLEKEQLTKLNNEFTAEKKKLELEYQAKIKEARDKGNKEEAARLKAERDDKIATVKSQIMQDTLGADKAKSIESQLATDKKGINDKYNASILSAKKNQENNIDAINKEAREKEVAAKRKAWKAQQNADIASAIIAGALATIKALASAFFPVNLVFAAATAVATGIQVAMIKRQPEPTFALGGIPQGPRHGSKYGESGLAIVDRRNGREVGEMEGGEAIISRDQTEANMPLIQAMFRNARTAGRRKVPVLRDPIALAEGGIINVPRLRMYEYGGRAEYEDSENRNDAGGGGASISNENDSSISSSSDGGQGINEAEARAASEEAKKQGEMQLKLLQAIADNVKSVEKMTNDVGMATVMKLNEVKNATDNVAQKVQGVEGAIWGTNQSGRLDQLIGAISNFGKG